MEMREMKQIVWFRSFPRPSLPLKRQPARFLDLLDYLTSMGVLSNYA